MRIGTMLDKKMKTIFKIFTLFLLFPVFVFGGGNYAPIMVDDILIFVPYSKVKISLGADKTISQNEHQLLQPTIEHSEDVVSYEWLENGQLLGSGVTFSTSSLSVGTHTITFQITDINGVVVTDVMTITIQEYITGDAFVGTTKGEFSVNQGTANYSLKIAVPPGIAGMVPQLSLQYNSQGGNGYMGVGWSIDGISSITRCSQTKATDGVNHTFGVQYNSNDRFCLDGQRLINVQGAYGASDTEYKTEINNYSKIISRASFSGGPNYFDVYTKSGLHYVYGLSDSSYDKRTGTPKLSWRVDKIIDSYGNTIYFKYQKDESKGIHYLSKVSYAGIDADDPQSNTIEYVYEDNRLDVISGYENGYPYTISKRLSSVVVRTGSEEIRRYNILYENEASGAKLSKVSSITEEIEEAELKTLYFTHSSKGTDAFKAGESWSNDFGSNVWDSTKYIRTMSDVNGDGLPDIVGFGSDAIYVSLGTGSAFENASSWSDDFTYNNGWRIGIHTRAITDVNADGLPDIVGFGNLGVYVALNNGNGFDTTYKWSNDFGSNVWDSTKYIRTMSDVNGDGLPDIVGFGSDAVYVSLNSGNGFNAATKWSYDFTYNNGWRIGTHERMMSDVNGDGLPDIVGFGNLGVYVALNNGNGFDTTYQWSNDFGSNVWDTTQHIRTLSDVNGDGLPDIVGFGNLGVYVALNKGNGFKSAISWTDDFGANQWSVTNHVRILSDVNGDGLDDIVGFGNYAVHVALSTGNSFESSSEWVQGFSYGLYGWRTDMHERFLPDVDGDGLPDIVGFGNSAVYVGTSYQENSLLTRITNNADQDIKIDYGDMINNEALYHNYSQHGERNAYAWNNIANENIELSVPRSLVSSVSQIDGIGGENKVDYKYFGYIANKLRGLQGFHAIDTLNYTDNTNSEIRYKQIEAPDGLGFQYTGMPYLTYEADTLVFTTSNIFSRTDITYQNVSSYANVYEPYTFSNVETIYDPKSKQHIKSIYHTNTMSADGLGNITQKVSRVQDKVNNTDFYKTIDNVYDKEDISSWYIGRLTQATVTHTQTDGHTVVRSSTFDYNSHGLLSEEVSNVGTDVALTKTYSYDGHGNKISETLSGNSITTATTQFTYSSDGKFQTSVTNAIGLQTSKTYDKRFGTLTSLTRPDGVTTTWTYDGLGRKYREKRADGTSTVWLHKWYGNATINSTYLHYVQTVSSGLPDTYVLYDSLGRERSAYTTTLGGKKLYTQLRTFNKKGEPTKEALPYIEDEGSMQYVTSTYDDYGRLVTQSKPSSDGSTQTSTHSYQGFTVVTTDPNDIQKQIVKNAIGQVLHATDAFGEGVASSIDYSYDAVGNLLSTTDSQGNTISMQYDAAGNKTYLNDPDLGIWQYRYRSDGQLYTQWSGSGTPDSSKHVTEIAYDTLGRVTSKTIYDKEALGSQGANAYSYNYTSLEYNANNGRVSKEYFESRQDDGVVHGGHTTPTYDTLGRVISTDKTIYSKGSFVSSVSYDAYSRPSRVTYPNGYSVANHYSYGILDSVTGSDGKVHYKINKLSAYGQVSDATYGNGVRTVKGYNDAGALESIRSGTNGHYYSADVQNLQYTYDKLGNVLTRDDYSIAGKEIKESFGYDAMNRLTSVVMQTDVVHTGRDSIDYAYDSIGNMMSQSGLGAYTYYADKPHAVKSVGSRTYTYDSVGNVVNRDGDAISYNAMNQPTIITGKNGNTVHFAYNTQGQRYQKEVNGIHTYYLGKAYEEEVQSNGTDKKQTCYISVRGQTVATHVEVVDETYSINTSNPYYKTTYNRYFHTDALGSIVAITDDSGTVLERRSHNPFGKIRAMDYGLTGNNAIIPANTVTQTTRAYTGHEQIKEIDGLIHMNARIYDSDIGRFLSADTLIQDPLDSQAYNRYSYVRNNPMKFTDPSGHSWLSKAWKKVKNWVKKNARAIGAVIAAAVVAVVAPYLLPGLTGLASTAATGALAGAAAGAIQTKSLKGALKGALFGAVGAVAAVGVVNITAKVFNIAKIGTVHSMNFINSGINKVTLFKAAAHGLARGAIQSAQGGSFKAGFLSGFSSGIDVGTSGYGGFVGRTTIMGIVGGTASALGGGKFSNGAMSGAFTHMFNAEGARFMKGTDMNKIEGRAKYYTKEAKMERGQAIQKSLQVYSKPMMAAGVTAFAVLSGGIIIEGGLALIGPYYATVGSVTASNVIWTIEGYYGGVPTNTYGSAISGFESRTGIDIIPSWLKP